MTCSSQPRCLFLMGAHRSGTTWLHQLLASSEEIAFITFWDIVQQLHPGPDPLERQTVAQTLQCLGDNRSFDNVAIGLDTPEEYGWVLEQSPFNIYTRRPVSNTRFEPLVRLIEAKRTTTPNNAYLLLKNPVDFYDGFLKLEQDCPDAAFLFLHRHPLAVFRSQVIAWRQLFEGTNHYMALLSPEYSETMNQPVLRRQRSISLRSATFLETMLVMLAESFAFHVDHEPLVRAQSLQLRYEDLCADPAAQLSNISNWLQLRQPISPAQQLASQPRQLGEDPLILEVYNANRHRFAAYCAWLGYDVAAEQQP
jgi:hypothetical protein